MSDIYFNVARTTHSLRILPVDQKPDDVTVFEALVDGTDYVWFEGHPNLEIWELIELAIQSFMDYRVNDDTVKIQWRD